MPRIFIQPGSITDGTVSLPEPEAKRLYRVLRLRPGDPVQLFDGQMEYHTEITSITAKSAELKILSSCQKPSEPTLDILLGQGYPKGEKLEWVLQKAVELGVSYVVPVVMERSVKRPDLKDIEHKLARLRRIATEAAQQSGRVRVPEVPCFMDLPMFLEHARSADLKIIFYEGENTVGLRNLLHGVEGIKSVALLVGPEGGLTEDEVLEAESAGFVSAGLGPRILRTETAGIAAISIIQYERGDIG